MQGHSHCLTYKYLSPALQGHFERFSVQAFSLLNESAETVSKVPIGMWTPVHLDTGLNHQLISYRPQTSHHLVKALSHY